MTKQQTKSKAQHLPKCEHCGAEFLPRSAWQKFCSNACRVAAWLKQNKPKPASK